MLFQLLLLSLFVFSGFSNPTVKDEVKQPKTEKLENVFIASVYANIYNLAAKKPMPTQICAATIVSEKWLLTAAECLDDMAVSAKGSLIIVDVPDDEPKSQILEVKKVFRHPQYQKRRGTANNIGLICLEDSLTFNSVVKSLDLPKENEDLIGSGYVIQKDSNSGQSMAVTFPFVPESDCLNYYESLNNTLFCAGIVGINSCPTDIGSPFVYKETVTGIHMLPKSLCTAKYPTAFIRVSEHLEWIKQTMKNECL